MYKVLHLGRKNIMHQCMLGMKQLESKFTEEDLEVLVIEKLTISQ